MSSFETFEPFEPFEPFELERLLSNSADLARSSATTSAERTLTAQIEDAAANVQRYLGLGPKGIFAIASGLTVAMQATWLLNGYTKPVRPDTGGAFRDGHQAFSTDISDTLGNAQPTNWSGDAAVQYQSVNTMQQERVNTVAEGDRRVARMLAEQAREVENADKELTTIEVFFLTLLPIEAGLFVISWMPGMRATAYMLMVLVLGMMVALYAAAFVIVLQVGARGDQTKRDLRAVISDYQSVAHDAAALAANVAVPTVAVPAASMSAIPNFSSVISKLADAPAESDVASAVSGVLDEHASAVTQADQVLAAGQAAGISGRVSQYANLGATPKQSTAKADSTPAADEQGQGALVDAAAVAAPAAGLALAGAVPAQAVPTAESTASETPA